MSKTDTQKRPWNKGKSTGQKSPFSSDQVKIIRGILTEEAKAGSQSAVRDLALFNTAIDTMLRSGDLLALTVSDVTDHEGRVLEEFPIKQEKTGDSHVVALSVEGRAAIAQWLLAGNKMLGDVLFTGFTTNSREKGISRRQFRRLVKKWAEYARLDPRKFSGHSTRRTKSSVVYQRTQNLAACKELLGHKSIGSTADYLGVDKRSALDLAKKINL